MKRGFTLIELMAVIVVLGIVAVIVMPTIDRFVRKAQYASYDVQIDAIIDGAKNWTVDNTNRIPDNNNETISIYLSELKNGGFVREDLINPLTDQSFSNNTLIVITKKNDGLLFAVNPE